MLINDWSVLWNTYGKRCAIGLEINRRLNNKLDVIEETGKSNVEKKRYLSYKKEMKAKSEEHSDIFNIYSKYFELMQFHTYVFEKDIDITENDIVVKIWSPLIEVLFRRSVIRTKYGESMGESADEENKTTGMKVDLRFLKDTLSRRQKEMDKADCEVGKMGAGHVKITSDRTKLFIETKIIIDHLIKEEPEKLKEIVVPALQLIGINVILFSVNLAVKGLYIALKEKTTVVTSHISHIKDFKEVVTLLYKFETSI